MIFCIMERLAGEPVFLIEGVPAAVSFSDSLYFSLITISTVGFFADRGYVALTRRILVWRE